MQALIVAESVKQAESYAFERNWIKTNRSQIKWQTPDGYVVRYVGGDSPNDFRGWCYGTPFHLAYG